MAKFCPGTLLMTRGVQAICEADNGLYGDLFNCLGRHIAGDWGDVPDEDRRANDRALEEGSRVLSSYQVAGQKVWLITEADRSSSTFLLPSEY